jgi:hypothetical protein
MRSYLLKGGIALVIIISTVFLSAACSVTTTSPQVKILPSLKTLELKGKLIFVQVREQGNQLAAMDLSDGSIQSLFEVPERGFIGAADLSPNGKQIVMSYAPPPPGNTPQFGITDLYLLPVGGNGKPQALVTHQLDAEVFSNPVWSPDGQTILYTHNVPASGSAVPTSESRIERIIPGGQPQVLFHNGQWPSFTLDGTKVAYLTGAGNSINEIRIGGAEGSDAWAVLPAGRFPFVDAHFFSPDGNVLIFSAASGVKVGGAAQPQPLSVSGGLLGAAPVYAHPQASDWYQIALANGQVKRLADVRDSNMIGAFSPDGKWIAYISPKGVFVMRPDGSGLTQIASLMGTGSLKWVS